MEVVKIPYITKERRKYVDRYGPENLGDLAYWIYKGCCQYEAENPVCFDTLSSIVGVLECVKSEYYRRIIVPYEKIKMEQNGDVNP